MATNQRANGQRRSSNGAASSNGNRRITAASAARHARNEFEELTQTPVDRIAGVERTDEGWRITVEGLELRRVPETMDVLGVYELELDKDGNVKSWHRTGRHHRSQVQEL
jgi:hypothetical protein